MGKKNRHTKPSLSQEQKRDQARLHNKKYEAEKERLSKMTREEQVYEIVWIADTNSQERLKKALGF